MKKKLVLFIVPGVILALLIAFSAVWVFDLIPPVAAAAEEPFAGTVNGCEGLTMTIGPDTLTPLSAEFEIQ